MTVENEAAPGTTRESGTGDVTQKDSRALNSASSAAVSATWDIALAPRKNSARWSQRTTTFRGVASMTENPADSKECGNYLLGRLRGGRRAKNTVISRSWIALDADKADETLWEDVEALPYQVIEHTTFSSEPGELRLRILIPLDRDATPAEYTLAVQALMDQLGAEKFDPGSVQPERYMFKPSTQNPDWYRSFVKEDAPTAVLDSLLVEIGPVRRATAAVVAALQPYWPGEGSRDLAAMALAGALLRDAYDDDEYEGEVKGIITALAEQTGDEEVATRAEETVPLTRAKLSAGQETTGWTTLSDRCLTGSDRKKATAIAAARQATASLRVAMGVPPEGGDPFEAIISQLDGADVLTETPTDWNDAHTHSQNRVAARFATVARGRGCYVHGSGWHYWDGRRWAPDHGNARTHRLLDALLRTSMTSALADPGLLAAIKAASTASGARGVLELAATREGMFVEDVDRDPYLLNCANGTLDLQTFELRPADPADNITKVTNAAYDPDAPGSNWKRILEESLPDPEVRAYLQRYVGLSLLGHVEEHLMVFAHGRGRNAKGLTAYTIQRALGDYAVTATTDLLIARGHAKSAGDYAAVMQLRGARWGVMSEMDRGAKIDVAAFKAITGGDVLSAKAMRQDFVNFSPSHSLMMLTNHLPLLSSDESAAWDRVRVIPYEVSFSGREDTHLPQRLALELEAVLAWAVEGLKDYRARGGMDEPAAVRGATSAYRRENDVFAQFLGARCVLERGAKTASEVIRVEYNAFLSERRQLELDSKAWLEHMEEVGGEYGIALKRPQGRATLYGIRLRAPFDD